MASDIPETFFLPLEKAVRDKTLREFDYKLMENYGLIPTILEFKLDHQNILNSFVQGLMPKYVVFFVPLGQILAITTGQANLVSPMPSALFNPAFTLKLDNQGHEV